MSKDSILVINCGSSSLKFAVINPATEEETINGIAERMGSSEALIRWKIAGQKGSKDLGQAAHEEAISALMDVLKQENLIESISAIGHRVVHGGETFTESCLVTDEVLAAIEDTIKLAPLHNPANLTGIHACQKIFPGLPNAVVFDTAFHQSMPAEAYLYPVPYSLYKEQGVRRYGFHGTSYRYIGQTTADMLGMDINDSCILVAHLGNGASACAIKNGKSIDTTMGLTPLEGLVMGTRSGDVDPNLFSYLNKTLGYSLDETTDMLNKKSGLLGLSEMDSDCRVIEDAAAEGNERAQLTLDVFSHVLAEKLAGFAAALGRIDALVFTGGIGENSATLRKQVIERLSIFGFKLNEQLNEETFRGKSGVITEEGSTVAMVVATNEELMISRDTQALTA
ncbi:acetate kinase [Endozoicomonas sp. OPT23]|uniref:acetate kinase n=1 Tax=Endozoicomonas sp. OPT23 TaxID=2072845 RepID=UPI00129C0DA1|nr:acetate kinase [Endozoicomonas sp. OPT23]MRI33461.1 acetate kinase [Endozoicomonas sp. OPT23]